MAYNILTTNKYKKDLLRCEKRGLPLKKLGDVVDMLRRNGSLPQKYHPHKLSGKYAGCWECHIMADWLLVWKQNDKELVLLLTDTGTHSELFGK